jgi:ankyrin repeat protein
MAGAPRTNPDGSLFACKGLCEEEISADRELQWKVMEEERARVARLLVSAGVDIHVRDSGGMTALGYAVKGKHEGVAAILEEFGGVV